MSPTSPQQRSAAASNMAKRLSDITAWHDVFVNEIQKTVPDAPGGSFGFDGQGLVARVLGVPLRVEQKAVLPVTPLFTTGASTGDCVEYRFLAEQHGREIEVWRLYLADDGVLYEDVALQTKVVNHNNGKLPQVIVPVLAERALPLLFQASPS